MRKQSVFMTVGMTIDQFAASVLLSQVLLSKGFTIRRMDGNHLSQGRGQQPLGAHSSWVNGHPFPRCPKVNTESGRQVCVVTRIRKAHSGLFIDAAADK